MSVKAYRFANGKLQPVAVIWDLKGFAALGDRDYNAEPPARLQFYVYISDDRPLPNGEPLLIERRQGADIQQVSLAPLDLGRYLRQCPFLDEAAIQELLINVLYKQQQLLPSFPTLPGLASLACYTIRGAYMWHAVGSFSGVNCALDALGARLNLLLDGFTEPGGLRELEARIAQLETRLDRLEARLTKPGKNT